VDKNGKSLSTRVRRVAAAASTGAESLRPGEAIQRGDKRKARAAKRRIAVSSMVALWVVAALTLIVVLRTSSPSSTHSNAATSGHSSSGKTPERKSTSKASSKSHRQAGGSTGTTTPRRSTGAHHAGAATVATCAAADITPAVSSTGGGAYLGSGQLIDAVLLTNSSSDPCEIGGYPTVSFFGADGADGAAVSLVASTAPGTVYMDIPIAFTQVSAATMTTLQPAQSAVVYYSYNARAVSDSCATENAGLYLSWTGSAGQVQFPSATGLTTIEACAGAQVTFTQIGPEEPQVLVPGPANGS
jgi:hypothetical protein